MPKKDSQRISPSVFRETPGSVKSLRKFYKDPLNLPDKYSLQGELAGESDRASVILMASLLDDALMYRISKHLCFEPTREEFDKVFRFEGPLGTFSARMEMACLFGFIEDETYEQLTLIREMRNACAHSKHALKFTDAVLGNVLKRMFAPLGVISPDIAGNEAKGSFLVEGIFIYYSLYLGSREEGAKAVKEMLRDLRNSSPSQ